MISAVIVLSLLSLLVATEPELPNPSVHPLPKPSSRPGRKVARDKPASSDHRLAA